jgi:hypothetical protein
LRERRKYVRIMPIRQTMQIKKTAQTNPDKPKHGVSNVNNPPMKHSD